jgi:hypothetical protein
MGYGSLLVVFRQPADSALCPHHAVESGWSLAAGHQKEMSSMSKNQAPAPDVRTLTAQSIDVNPVPLDLRQWPVS